VRSAARRLPPHGTLLLDRAAPEERGYARSRARRASPEGPHAAGGNCPGASGAGQLWCGFRREPLANQLDPRRRDYDGIASRRPALYFAATAGLLYRVPVDPSGGNNPLNGNDLFFGAVVDGVPTTSGRVAAGSRAHEYVESATGTTSTRTATRRTCSRSASSDA
jgi:hypothetical protein